MESIGLVMERSSEGREVKGRDYCRIVVSFCRSWQASFCTTFILVILVLICFSQRSWGGSSLVGWRQSKCASVSGVYGVLCLCLCEWCGINSALQIFRLESHPSGFKAETGREGFSLYGRNGCEVSQLN